MTSVETALKEIVQDIFAQAVGLSHETLYGSDLTLGQIIDQSAMTNSIDLMEALGKTALGIKQQYGISIRLPQLPLDTPISAVIAKVLDLMASSQKGNSP